MKVFESGTPLEIAVILAIIYFAWQLVRAIMPYVFKENTTKIDDILQKLDDIVDKLNTQITNSSVHDIRIQHIEEDVKKLEKDIKNLKQGYNVK